MVVRKMGSAKRYLGREGSQVLELEMTGNCSALPMVEHSGPLGSFVVCHSLHCVCVDPVFFPLVKMRRALI